MMKSQLLELLTNRLSKGLPDISLQRAREEARELLEYSEKWNRKLDDLVDLRIRHQTPVSYITNTAYFWDLKLYVDKSVLIPRPCSETIVEAALEKIKNIERPHILDLGTGSGCLLLSVLNSRSDATGIGLDASQDALNVAMKNAKNAYLDSRCEFVFGDFTSELNFKSTSSPDKRFNLILSNPPYISESEMKELPPSVANYEPKMALYGGTDGLDCYRAILQRIRELKVREMVTADMSLIFETGHLQADSVRELIHSSNIAHACTIRPDLRGIDRCVIASCYPPTPPSCPAPLPPSDMSYFTSNVPEMSASIDLSRTRVSDCKPARFKDSVHSPSEPEVLKNLAPENSPPTLLEPTGTTMENMKNKSDSASNMPVGDTHNPYIANESLNQNGEDVIDDGSNVQMSDVAHVGTIRVNDKMMNQRNQMHIPKKQLDNMDHFSKCEDEFSESSPVDGLVRALESVRLQTSSKPLLILDMNGLLVVRHRKHGKSMKYIEDFRRERPNILETRKFFVWIRPHVQEFIKFAFENFDVAVWSSARKRNVMDLIDLVIPSRELQARLAFVYCQTDCDILGKHPHNDEKDLFIKDLARVWDKFPQYSPENTLLLDDSFYKAAKNPAFTSIHPKDWVETDLEDNQLSSAGPLRRYLSQLATEFTTNKVSVPVFLQTHKFESGHSEEEMKLQRECVEIVINSKAKKEPSK